jgi:enoyl-CoA hydratase/carnithine racemase
MPRSRGAVHLLTLNRPDALNAITHEMASEPGDYFGAAFHDRCCRIVVMRGAGRIFCASLDNAAFMRLGLSSRDRGVSYFLPRVVVSMRLEDIYAC